MIGINYDHNKMFGLLKFYSGYEKFNLNSPKGYCLKKINAQTVAMATEISLLCFSKTTSHRALIFGM